MEDPLKPFRRRLRRWIEAGRLARERGRYLQRFRAARLSIPDEETITRILRQRYPHVVAKPRGELTILALYHHYNWEDLSLLPALKKFGNVIRYDWFERLGVQEGDWPRSLRPQLNEDLRCFLADAVRRLRPDCIFTYLSGEQVTVETIQAMAAYGIPSINLSLNDKENFVGRVYNGQALGVRDICRHFSLCWTSTADAVIKYVVEGALPIYMPEGANPDFHKPYNLPRDIDVSFVGQRYGKRPEVVTALWKAGIAVTVHGIGWPEGPLPAEEMVKMYSRSKINLGFAGVGDLTETFCLKGRDFEIPMSGGLYLTEHHRELEEVYRIGEEIVTWRHPDDLIPTIRWLLDNPQHAHDIRHRGRQRALKEHTWESRFEKIFSLMGML